jgi:ketosteroid isomerase-like protein
MDERVGTIAELYERFKTRDWSGLRDLFADDAEFGVTGRNPLAGTYRGPAAVVEVLQRLVDETGDTIGPHRDDTWDICTSEHHVIFIEWLRASRAGKTASFYIHLVCALENGKILRAFANFVDQYEFDELWT